MKHRPIGWPHWFGLLFLWLSPVQANDSLSIGEPHAISGGGTMVVCQSTSDGSPVDLLIHFHGAVSVSADNFTKSKLKGALVIINFKGLSAAYAKPFNEDPKLFAALIDNAASQHGLEEWGRISVSSFSAGYGAVREILKTPENVNRIDALLAADSMYATLDKKADERRPIEAHMRDYTRFAKLASEGKKTFVITHTSQDTPYASTTETSTSLLEFLGMDRKPMARLDAESLQLASKATKGNFTVLGYEGSTGEDHMQHLRQIHLWWRLLDSGE